MSVKPDRFKAMAEFLVNTCNNIDNREVLRNYLHETRHFVAEALRTTRQEALDEAEKIAVQHSEGYQRLRELAKQDGDKDAALAHFWEMGACHELARAIRALKVKE